MVLRLRNKDGSLSAPVGFVPRAGGGYTRAPGGSKTISAAKAIESTNRQVNARQEVVLTAPKGSINPQVGVAVPTGNNVGNIIIGSTGQVIPVADTQTRSRSLRNSIANAYARVDTALGGFLPGAATPTQVRTDRTIRRSSEQQALNAARAEAQKQQDSYLLQQLANQVSTSAQETILKEQLDQSRTRGLERFGLFRSDEEQSVQELLSRQAYLNSLSQNIPQLQEAFLSAQQSAGGSDAFQAFNDSLQPKEDKGFFDSIGDGLKGAGIATIVLVGAGLFLLSRNK